MTPAPGVRPPPSAKSEKIWEDAVTVTFVPKFVPESLASSRVPPLRVSAAAVVFVPKFPPLATRRMLLAFEIVVIPLYVFAAVRLTTPPPAPLMVTPLAPVPEMTPEIVMPPPAAVVSERVFAPSATVPATFNKLLELFMKASEAFKANPKFGPEALETPTVVACAPEFIVIPAPATPFRVSVFVPPLVFVSVYPLKPVVENVSAPTA